MEDQGVKEANKKDYKLKQNNGAPRKLWDL